MKPIVIVAILLAVCIGVAVFAGSNIEWGTDLNVYVGRVKVNLVELKRLDGSVYGMTNTWYRMLHADGDYNNKVGTISTAKSVTGDLLPEDNGYWTLCLDYGNTSHWLDIGETLADERITDIYGQDGDRDGFDETYMRLWLGNLGALKAGESYKEVEVNLIYDVADLNPAFTSLTNASSIGTSSYSYYTATGYTTGTAEGEMAKIAKIVLDFSATDNETYPDAEYWKLTHFRIGAYTFTASQFGGYDLANKRYQIKFGDQTNHFGGKDLYYAKNGGTLWAPYELKAYCNYPSASKTIYVTVSFYLYQNDGTLTSAISRIVSFAS